MPRASLRTQLLVCFATLVLVTGCDMDIDFSGLDDGGFTGCYLCYAPEPGAPIPFDSTPVAVAGGLTFSALSVGGLHACGISGEGTWCWGSLDAGTANFRSVGAPTKMPGANGFTRLDAGNAFTCALDAASHASCWGINPDGELGIGAFGPAITIPASVSGGQTFSQLSLSRAASLGEPSHACGLTSSGAGYCWGSNMYAQLGNATTTSSGAPVRVAGDIVFESITVGVQFTCGIANGGEAFCWGYAAGGRLGNDQRESTSCAPEIASALYCYKVPTRVAGGFRFAAISAGAMHACALDAAGAAYCWGGNLDGQLGTGAYTWSFEPVRTAGDQRFTTISAGTRSTCALTAEGRAFCWGNNVYGQVGDGTTVPAPQPRRVLTDLRFATISVGRDTACGLTTSGAAYCWGSNEQGKLGKGP